MKWFDKTTPPKPDVLYIFYDDQLGMQFIAFGNTIIPYTYYRELTEEEKANQ